MKRILLSIILSGMVFGGIAQSELTLPFMRDVFQTTYINPSVLPEHTVSIGIPGVSVYSQFITNGFVPNNFMKFVGDSLRIDPVKFVNSNLSPVKLCRRSGVRIDC